MLKIMQLPKLNAKGMIVPLLPVVGVLLLALGIAVAVSLATNRNSRADIRSKAAQVDVYESTLSEQEELAPVDYTPPPQSIPNAKRNFSDFLK